MDVGRRRGGTSDSSTYLLPARASRSQSVALQKATVAASHALAQETTLRADHAALQLGRLRLRPRCFSLAPAPALLLPAAGRFPATQRLRERSIQLAFFVGGVFSRTLCCPAALLASRPSQFSPSTPVAHGLFSHALPPRNLPPTPLHCAVRSLSSSLQVKCSFRHCSFPVPHLPTMALPTFSLSSRISLYHACHEPLCTLPSFCCEFVN